MRAFSGPAENRKIHIHEVIGRNDGDSRVPTSRVAPGQYFSPGMALLMLATVFLGFARSYFLAGVFNAPLPNWLIHLHGAAFSSWILLLTAWPRKALPTPQGKILRIFRALRFQRQYFGAGSWEEGPVLFYDCLTLKKRHIVVVLFGRPVCTTVCIVDKSSPFG